MANARCNNTAGLASTWGEVQTTALADLLHENGADLAGLMARLEPGNS